MDIGNACRLHNGMVWFIYPGTKTAVLLDMALGEPVWYHIKPKELHNLITRTNKINAAQRFLERNDRPNVRRSLLKYVKATSRFINTLNEVPSVFVPDKIKTLMLNTYQDLK